MKNTIKIVFVIIASIIGAGFASGKEIYSFFFIYGKRGVIGIILSNIIISFVIYRVLIICKKNNINSYSNFCKCIVKKNKFYSLVLNNIVNIFLLISFFIMVVGFASLLEQELGIKRLISAILIIFLNYLFSIKKAEGIIKLSNCLIPIFIVFLLIILFKNNNFLNLFFYILEDNTNLCHTSFSVFFNVIDNWIIKSVLYASYNCVIVIPVIVIISEKINTKKSMIRVSIINFFVLTFFSFSIFNLLLQGDGDLYKLEMPIIAVVSKYGSSYKSIYIFLIMISIVTSLVSASVGFINNVSKNSKRLRTNLIIISFLAIPISYISFGALVSYIYPMLGFIGIIEMTHLGRPKKSKKYLQKI